MSSIIEKAKQALDCFEQVNRNGKEIYVLKENSPSWVEVMCYSAHFELLPNDIVYEAIHDILWIITELEDEDLDTIREHIDERLDQLLVTNPKLLRWFDECYPLSEAYVNRYKKECGSNEDVMEELSGGYYYHLKDISEEILSSLTQTEERLNKLRR